MCMTARCLASCCTARKKKSTGIRPMWAKRRPSDRKRRRREIAFCSGPAEDTPSRPGKRSGIRCKTPSGRRGNMSSARFSQSYREADSPARVLAYGSASRWSALGSRVGNGETIVWVGRRCGFGTESLSQNAVAAQANPSKEGGLLGQENSTWAFTKSGFGIGTSSNMPAALMRRRPVCHSHENRNPVFFPGFLLAQEGHQGAYPKEPGSLLSEG